MKLTALDCMNLADFFEQELEKLSKFKQFFDLKQVLSSYNEDKFMKLVNMIEIVIAEMMNTLTKYHEFNFKNKLQNQKVELVKLKKLAFKFFDRVHKLEKRTNFSVTKLDHVKHSLLSHFKSFIIKLYTLIQKIYRFYNVCYKTYLRKEHKHETISAA